MDRHRGLVAARVGRRGRSSHGGLARLPAIADRLRVAASIGTLVLAAAPSLLTAAATAAPGSGASAVRQALVLLASGTLAVGCAWSPKHPVFTTHLGWRALTVAGLGAWFGILGSGTAAEVWSVPVAALLLVFGAALTRTARYNAWWNPPASPSCCCPPWRWRGGGTTPGA
jgi:hypothetical protein